MRITLRLRIFLTLLPLLCLLAVLGSVGAMLLYRLSGSIGAILRENYVSVIAMEKLSEALERIDSSFQFALAGKEQKARTQYEHNWKAYEKHLQIEQNNITVPGEAKLVEQLTELTDRYRREGTEFYARSADHSKRARLYFGKAESQGLLHTFERIKETASQILRINQENMQAASQRSQALAAHSFFGFGIGLTVSVIIAIILALRTVRIILQPIRAVTESANAIGSGDLDQVIPVTSNNDELGQLAQAFNTMGRQLRSYRRTDDARLLRAQRASQATIDSFPDPVVVVDSESHVEMANPAAWRLLDVIPGGGHPPDTLSWKPTAALNKPLQEALQQQRNYLPEGFDHAIPLRCDGKDRLFLPRILSIHDPSSGTLGAAVVLQDVTRFQLLDQLKSNLVATVSHELKTPLTSIRLAVHLLLEESIGSLNPKQTELLLDARENAERILATINNLLNLAHLESGREWLDLHAEAPASLLQAAAEAVIARAQDKDIEIQVEAPPDLPLVEVDANRFGLALNNLLDNAITYTPRRGRITLSAVNMGLSVILNIADTGMGIPAEHLPHLFERFFRVPGQSRGSGTGLGLAIVHEIVTAHDGTIYCESQPGTGTVFHIALPAKMVSPTAVRPLSV